ncbi:polygalacturonase-1 non-catalytic subunit beta [Striga asiatica]|uniref:Polygalacturonase-1 non-catalytic subunit beta n=1 Tax=Striga asiatica TaxID=4170 RepID=A0A5A7RE00_STRAF|nr:polygalacturonase-1 non-catalytic subunit beta [Striga asiatica]
MQSTAAGFILLLHLLCFVPSFNGESPFTPKASLIRYWTNHISNTFPLPEFLLNKASPLSAAQHAAFSKLVATNPTSLSHQLSDFCTKAKLMCAHASSSPSLDKNPNDVNFTSYTDNKNFTNYGTDKLGGLDSFQKYSENVNILVDNFRRYSRNSVGHNEGFDSYAADGNVAEQRFNTYGASATAGQGQFSNYNNRVNVPHTVFTSYTDQGNARAQSFVTYAADANSGNIGFSNYGKNGNSAASAFSAYGKDSNVLGSTFSNYGNNGNAAVDNFTSYGDGTNNPQNVFSNYGEHGNAATESFASYRDQANVGGDNFIFYAKDSNAARVVFRNYGNSLNQGTDKFDAYGEESKTGFESYGTNNTFARYSSDNNATKFTTYRNATSSTISNKWSVEEGKFFREAKLREGTVMRMPDIKDKMPKRSFLPRTIASKLPFSTSRVEELKTIFHAADDNSSSVAKMVTDALTECERAPSRGETKRCVTSIEDMIDFATSVLGRNVAVRTTENTRGSNGSILIGEVTGINGGDVTKSVSCHQSLFPYLIYYCHSVPKVRVYVADIKDPNTKAKINNGVAICHLDTSDWSPGHGAFRALGQSPGKIEVCHWIFENDMTWTTAD